MSSRPTSPATVAVPTPDPAGNEKDKKHGKPGEAWKSLEEHVLPKNNLPFVCLACFQFAPYLLKVLQVMLGLMLSVFLAAMDQVTRDVDFLTRKS